MDCCNRNNDYIFDEQFVLIGEDDLNIQITEEDSFIYVQFIEEN